MVDNNNGKPINNNNDDNVAASKDNDKIAMWLPSFTNGNQPGQIGNTGTDNSNFR